MITEHDMKIAAVQQRINDLEDMFKQLCETARVTALSTHVFGRLLKDYRQAHADIADIKFEQMMHNIADTGVKIRDC